jgi:hypothetical protein
MAKRNSRSEANESSAAATPASNPSPGAPAQPPKNRRVRTEATSRERRTAAVDPSQHTGTDETFAARAGVGDVSPAEASAGETRSVSMGSEPSEEDIRQRAYQRYLARGGEDGRHFEDWLEAERELKTGK